MSPYLEKQGYPASFEFKGTIIFVSNRPLSKIPQAIQSRSLILNLDMTNAELCDHVRSIAHATLPSLTVQQRIDLIDFIHLHADTFKDLSIRTFIKGATLMAEPNWKNLIRFAL
ncbi:hypothetical protein QA633_02890 [Bradyrhizobium barranii]|uniref:hypothetical protein n=1 Tax=Bradyrhizobium barranii TaxID=2992140 RepID=UPI0024B06E39|nr:hypothetical protein [Bradyrhizobium barranii]WFT96082.1 hypothetical protein QA633_02890 [Bradyrhizobium barranii]